MFFSVSHPQPSRLSCAHLAKPLEISPGPRRYSNMSSVRLQHNVSQWDWTMPRVWDGDLMRIVMRVTLATLIPICAVTLFLWSFGDIWELYRDTARILTRYVDGDLLEAYGPGMFFGLLIGLPAALIALFAWDWMSPPKDKAETRCRACGYILRALSEPQSPECGERI